MKLSPQEISAAFAHGEWARQFPPLLDEQQAAGMLRIAPKTLGNWRRDGQLQGTYSKRGRAILYFRDRLVAHFFNPTEKWRP